MDEFSWALAAFVLLHIGVSATGLRSAIVNRIGEGPYRALFSVASLALLAWLIHGFARMRSEPFDQLNYPMWAPPEWFHWPAYIFIVLGLTLAFTGLFTPGPTVVGFEKRALAQDEPARGVLRITRHPFLWGVALWAIGHLLVNGERFAVMLFSVLALMSVLGARSIDRKGRARDAEAWDKFADVTSNAPFAAIAQGRNRLALGEMGWRALVAVLLVAIIAVSHQRLFGVPAFSTPS